VLLERANDSRRHSKYPLPAGKIRGQNVMFWDAHGEARVSCSGVELNCKRR
jgi:hypothetical protein